MEKQKWYDRVFLFGLRCPMSFILGAVIGGTMGTFMLAGLIGLDKVNPPPPIPAVLPDGSKMECKVVYVPEQPND